MFENKINIIPLVLIAVISLFCGSISAHAAKNRIDEPDNPKAAGFGKKLVEISIGSEENQLGAIRSKTGAIPFGMFFGPSSCLVDGSEKLHVVDCLNHRITVFDVKNKFEFYKSINYFTDKEHKSLMSDIAIAKDGSVYMADSTSRCIVKFSSLGLPEAVFGKPEAPAFPGMAQINEIAVDAKGAIYARDYSRNAVYRFDPKGKYAGTLTMNMGLCFNSQNLHPCSEFHADTKSWNIFMRTQTGELQKMIYEIKRETPDQNIQFIGMDNADNMYVKVFKTGKVSILKISSDGRKSETFAAHNQPDFDTTRYFFINPVQQVIYAIRYNGKAFEIDELEKK